MGGASVLRTGALPLYKSVRAAVGSALAAARRAVRAHRPRDQPVIGSADTGSHTRRFAAGAADEGRPASGAVVEINRAWPTRRSPVASASEIGRATCRERE